MPPAAGAPTRARPPTPLKPGWGMRPRAPWPAPAWALPRARRAWAHPAQAARFRTRFERSAVGARSARGVCAGEGAARGRRARGLPHLQAHIRTLTCAEAVLAGLVGGFAAPPVRASAAAHGEATRAGSGHPRAGGVVLSGMTSLLTAELSTAHLPGLVAKNLRMSCPAGLASSFFFTAFFPLSGEDMVTAPARPGTITLIARVDLKRDLSSNIVKGTQRDLGWCANPRTPRPHRWLLTLSAPSPAPSPCAAGCVGAVF